MTQTGGLKENNIATVSAGMAEPDFTEAESVLDAALASVVNGNRASEGEYGGMSAEALCNIITDMYKLGGEKSVSRLTEDAREARVNSYCMKQYMQYLEELERDSKLEDMLRHSLKYLGSRYELEQQRIEGNPEAENKLDELRCRTDISYTAFITAFVNETFAASLENEELDTQWNSREYGRFFGDYGDREERREALLEFAANCNEELRGTALLKVVEPEQMNHFLEGKASRKILEAYVEVLGACREKNEETDNRLFPLFKAYEESYIYSNPQVGKGYEALKSCFNNYYAEFGKLRIALHNSSSFESFAAQMDAVKAAYDGNPKGIAPEKLTLELKTLGSTAGEYINGRSESMQVSVKGQRRYKMAVNIQEYAERGSRLISKMEQLDAVEYGGKAAERTSTPEDTADNRENAAAEFKSLISGKNQITGKVSSFQEKRESSMEK